MLAASKKEVEIAKAEIAKLKAGSEKSATDLKASKAQNAKLNDSVTALRAEME